MDESLRMEIRLRCLEMVTNNLSHATTADAVIEFAIVLEDYVLDGRLYGRD